MITLDEFVESRQRLYRHDAERYPVHPGGLRDQLSSIVPSLHKDDDTTAALEGLLYTWAECGPAPGGPAGFEELARGTAVRLLGRRQGQALTYSCFAPELRRHGRVAEVEGVLRRATSCAYSGWYYLDCMAGT